MEGYEELTKIVKRLEGEEDHFVEILNVRSLASTTSDNSWLLGDRLALLDLAREQKFPRGTKIVREIIQSKRSGRWNAEDDQQLNETINELCDVINAEDLSEVMEYIKTMVV